jgi:hypothetical protein
MAVWLSCHDAILTIIFLQIGWDKFVSVKWLDICIFEPDCLVMWTMKMVCDTWCVWLCVCELACVWASVWVFVSVHMSVWACLHVSVCMCVFLCVCLCVYKCGLACVSVGAALRIYVLIKATVNGLLITFMLLLCHPIRDNV